MAVKLCCLDMHEEFKAIETVLIRAEILKFIQSCHGETSHLFLRVYPF